MLHLIVFLVLLWFVAGMFAYFRAERRPEPYLSPFESFLIYPIKKVSDWAKK